MEPPLLASAAKHKPNLPHTASFLLIRFLLFTIGEKHLFNRCYIARFYGYPAQVGNSAGDETVLSGRFGHRNSEHRYHLS